MKLTFVTHKLSHSGGGVSAVVEALSAALCSTVPEVRVLGLSDKFWTSEKVSWNGAAVDAFSVCGPNEVGWSPKLYRSLTTASADLVHTHGIWMATSAQVASWGSNWRRPYLVSPHGMLEPQALAISPWKKRAASLMFEDRHLSGAACIHALNVDEAEHIRAFGLRNPIAIVPNGVALPDLKAGSLQPPWACQLPTGVRILLFLGRLHPKKNLKSLIYSIAELKRSNRLGDWKLAVAGWGHARYTEELKMLVADLKLQNDVMFLGPLFGAEKDAALRHASCFILPSVSEGLPMSVLEAWAYGLPVVMTRECNLPLGFELGAACELTKEPQELAERLADFLKMSISELEVMGASGRALVEKHYSWEVVADSFVSLYSWVLGSGDRPDFVLAEEV